MGNKFSLIRTAQTTVNEHDNKAKQIVQFLKESDVLVENVTHALANIATKAADGAQLELMHLNSIAAFMAGVEAIAKALPNIADVTKQQNTIRALSAINVGPDGLISTAVQPVVDVGTRYPELTKKYRVLVGNYASSLNAGRPDGTALAAAAKQLQQAIDQAMRTAGGKRSPTAAAGPSMSGYSPSGS